jgi:CheY-specific phosphatase CheX
MSSDRQILVVDSADGALSGVMEEIDELGFRVIWVPNLAVALEFVTANPRLSLIIASSAVTAHGGLEFLARVKELAPDLRIIWGASSSQPRGERSRSQGNGPDSLIPEPFRIDSLRSAISELLSEHFYPAAVAQAIKDGALEVLSTHGDFRVDGGAFLVANQSALSDISAVIPFAGGVAGHLMVGMTREHAATLHASILPAARPARIDQLEDLIGELCNQILGRINIFFVQRGLTVLHGTPMFIRAAGSTLRYPGRQPSFAVTLTRGELRLVLEYYLSDFDRSRLNLPVITRTLALGEIHYF